MSCPAVGDLGVSEDVRAEPINVELLLKASYNVDSLVAEMTSHFGW